MRVVYWLVVNLARKPVSAARLLLTLTREMLDAMRPVTERSPIVQAMNTHANGDHCYGNQLLPEGIPIIATAPAIEEMQAVPPSLVHAVFNQLDLGPEFDAWAQRTFRRFDFEGIELRLPTDPFEGRRTLQVGARAVELHQVGPAHTPGDAIAHVPDAGVVFTGDILFIDATPIMWAGPVSNWLAACEKILELGARVLVPGHGPVTDDSGVRDVQRYLTYVRDEARARFAAGMNDEEAATTSTSPTFAPGATRSGSRSRSVCSIASSTPSSRRWPRPKR